MSSTGRNKAGKERDAFDFYTTPSWAVRRMLEARSVHGYRWLEPGAGDGHIIRAVNEYFDTCPPEWTAVELRRHAAMRLEQCAEHVQIGDFISWSRQYYHFMFDGWVKRFDLTIGNPPFKHALEFIQHALIISHEVWFFLRLNFLEGDERAPWLRQHTPDVYVLPNRVSGTRDGKTDSTAYCWMVFNNEPNRTKGDVRILEPTPLEERKRDYQD